MDFEALWLTVRLAATTTLLLLAIGIPLAWWLASTRAAWRPLIEAVTTLPILLPPTVLGFYLLVLLGPRTASDALPRASSAIHSRFRFQVSLSDRLCIACPSLCSH
jgi:molybdate transport system permease protein